MALNTVSSDRLSTNVKNTNFTSAEKQDLTNDILRVRANTASALDVTVSYLEQT